MTPPRCCRPTPQRGGFALFLRTNEESSLTSPARSAHHPPTSIRFARSVRKNLRTFSQKVHLFFQKSAYFPTGVAHFFLPSHRIRRTAAHFLPLPLAFASNFPNSLAPSHAQRRATANSSAGGHELALNSRALLPLCSRRKGRKRQLRNTFARNTSNTTLIFTHSYRSPIKK